MKWVEALREWNKGQDRWCIPRRDTEEYQQVRAIMEGKPIPKVSRFATMKKRPASPPRRAEAEKAVRGEEGFATGAPSAEKEKARKQLMAEKSIMENRVRLKEKGHVREAKKRLAEIEGEIKELEKPEKKVEEKPVEGTIVNHSDKMTDELYNIIKDYDKGHIKEQLYMDRLTRDASGASKKIDALQRYYAYMKKHHDMDPTIASRQLSTFRGIVSDNKKSDVIRKKSDTKAIVKPMEKPAEKPVEKPMEKSAEKPAFTKEKSAFGFTFSLAPTTAPKPASEPIPKPAPKPVPKPASEPVPKPAEKAIVPKTKRSELIGLLHDLTSSTNKVTRNKVMKTLQENYPKFVNGDFIQDMLGAKFGDFYPTPVSCLDNEHIKQVLKNAENVLEPSAGMGSMLDVIENINPQAKITAVELNRMFEPFLKELFPKVNVIQGNFFYEMPAKKNNFDTIVCNPPFSDGKNKKFYLQFLLRCLDILSHSTKMGLLNIIFICPTFVNTILNAPNKPSQIDPHVFFSDSDVQNAIALYNKDKMSPEATKKLMKKYYNKQEELTDKEQEQLTDYIEVPFDFAEGELLSLCKGFGGTNITAGVYLFRLRSSGLNGLGRCRGGTSNVPRPNQARYDEQQVQELEDQIRGALQEIQDAYEALQVLYVNPNMDTEDYNRRLREYNRQIGAYQQLVERHRVLADRLRPDLEFRRMMRVLEE